METDKEYAKPDLTSPPSCKVALLDCDYDNAQVTLSVEAFDPDTLMLYYGYSLDGGETFAPLEKWPRNTNQFQFTLQVPVGTRPEIMVRAYNQYDRYTDSNTLDDFKGFPDKSKSKQESIEPAVTSPVEKEVSLIADDETYFLEKMRSTDFRT